MKEQISMNRRKFLGSAGAAVAGTALLATARYTYAKELPELQESEPMAKALKYVAKADAKNRVGAKVVGGVKPTEQDCKNCAQYVPKADGKGLCKIIAGKLVQEAGWCSVWQPLPKK